MYGHEILKDGLEYFTEWSCDGGLGIGLCYFYKL